MSWARRSSISVEPTWNRFLRRWASFGNFRSGWSRSRRARSRSNCRSTRGFRGRRGKSRHRWSASRGRCGGGVVLPVAVAEGLGAGDARLHHQDDRRCQGREVKGSGAGASVLAAPTRWAPPTSRSSRRSEKRCAAACWPRPEISRSSRRKTRERSRRQFIADRGFDLDGSLHRWPRHHPRIMRVEIRKSAGGGFERIE